MKLSARTVALVFAAAGILGLFIVGTSAMAQTITPFYPLTMDGKVLREHSTLAYCEEAARTSAKYPEVVAAGASAVLSCPKMLRYKPAATTTPPVVTPPVVVPPVVTPPASTPPATSAWVVGPFTGAEPKTPRPAQGIATPDPSFGTPIFRVTDRADPPKGFARNDYSRRQAFNANNSLQLIYALDGYWHVFDANTFKYVKRLTGLAGDAEPQWHPTNPDVLYFLPTNGIGMVVNELTVSTNTVRQFASLAARLKAKWPTAMAAWTKSEGSPSADGRYWCFMVDGDDWKSVGIITWDMQTDTILGTQNTNGDRPDHVSMSPTGKYCVTSHTDATKGTTAWTRDFSASRKLLASSQHSDLALAADGTDVFVAVDYGANEGDLFFTNLETGVRTKISATYFGDSSGRAFHFSGKAFGKPGWVLISSQLETAGKTLRWMDRKLTLVELKPSGRVLNVAWHKASFPASDYYFYSPVGSISRDGSRVAFTSAWGGTTLGDINAYQARLPAIP